MVHNSFSKPIQKPYLSFIKPAPVFLRKCSVYNSFHGARNECVHVSVNHTICKASLTHFSECAVHVRHKDVLSSLSVNTVSVPPVNVVKVTPHLTNPTSKHAIVRKPVFYTLHVNNSPAPAAVTLNSSLLLNVCDVPVPKTCYVTLREKCPNTELFLVRIQSEYRKIRTRNNSVFGHFSRSVMFVKCLQPYLFPQISAPHPHLMLTLKNFLIFTNN